MKSFNWQGEKGGIEPAKLTVAGRESGTAWKKEGEWVRCGRYEIRDLECQESKAHRNRSLKLLRVNRRIFSGHHLHFCFSQISLLRLSPFILFQFFSFFTNSKLKNYLLTITIQFILWLKYHFHPLCFQ